VAQGVTVVSVLHEVSMALHADDVVVMAAGRVLHHGASSDAATHRALERCLTTALPSTALPDQWMALPKLN
jgi:iron complex transport system ATP-binding protein